MPDPLVTAQELGDYSGITPPADLARWQMILRLASAEVRGFTGQTLSQVAADVVVMGASSGIVLFLPELPVTAITTVLVSGVATTAYQFTATGELYSGNATVAPTAWSDGATVTYDHGWAEFSPELDRIKSVVMDVALRAVTLNERSASEALGSTLMESAGYSPEIFLTPGEKQRLADYSLAGVG
jgi:hypothetical protein